MEPVYLHNWSDFSDMARDFEQPISHEIDVLLASYGTDNYCGDAFVLFRKDDKLFEVNAGHCSCYGVEDQWSPEETTVASLRKRLNEGTLGSDDYTDNVFKDELKAILDAMPAECDTPSQHS